MPKRNLIDTRDTKKDEFYTQLVDIEKELRHYRDQFRNKVVYCNCDDPFESNFFKYFALNFNTLGLKKLIATSFKPSPIANTQLGLFGDDKTLVVAKGRPKTNANKFIINDVKDLDGDGAFDLGDVAKQLKANKKNEWSPLKDDGDFRSPESIELLKQADIVVTNPPFSLFQEYVVQLMEYKKRFLIIGNQKSITVKEIIPLLMKNKMWLGLTMNGSNRWFSVPDHYPFNKNAKHKVDENGTHYIFVNNPVWFTNLDHGRRHEKITLYKKYKPGEFPKYDNYDAIDISVVDEKGNRRGSVNYIPIDYDGVMGVPITFLHKYNPDQFEIVGVRKGNDGKDLSIDGKCPFYRILIRNKELQK